MSQVLSVTLSRFSSKSAGFIIGGMSSIYLTISGTANTFLIHQYQKLFQAYEFSNPMSTPDPLKERFQQVLEDLKIDDIDKELSKIFMSIRPNLHHIGLLGSKYSFRIGIPLKFSYKNSADINPNMKIESNSVNWDSEEGHTLKETLVLSENAQKFALAQEVYKCDFLSYYVKLMMPCLGIGLAYVLAYKGHEKYQLYQKPIQARLVFYSGACVFAYGLYVVLADRYEMVMEQMSLKKLSSLGKDYIEGGIEFLDKELRTNQVLRTLLHDGPSNIATTGNYNYFIRQKSLPLTHQKSFLEKELTKLNEPSESSEVKPEDTEGV